MIVRQADDGSGVRLADEADGVFLSYGLRALLLADASARRSVDVVDRVPRPPLA